MTKHLKSIRTCFRPKRSLHRSGGLRRQQGLAGLRRRRLGGYADDQGDCPAAPILGDAAAIDVIKEIEMSDLTFWEANNGSHGVMLARNKQKVEAASQPPSSLADQIIEHRRRLEESTRV